MTKALTLSMALAAMLVSAPVNAAVLSLTSGTAANLPSSYSLPASSGAAVGEAVTIADSVGEGLLLDGPALITFTYMGKEAGYTNLFNLVVGNVTVFSTATSSVGDTTGPFAMSPDGGGFLPFKFVSNSLVDVTNGNVTGASIYATIAFKLVNSFANSAVYLAMLNDHSTSDADYDDMVIRISAFRRGEGITEVPLPAGLVLLMSGLFGVGFLARSRAKSI